jgi:hypothetical protein
MVVRQTGMVEVRFVGFVPVTVAGIRIEPRAETEGVAAAGFEAWGGPAAALKGIIEGVEDRLSLAGIGEDRAGTDGLPVEAEVARAFVTLREWEGEGAEVGHWGVYKACAFGEVNPY